MYVTYSMYNACKTHLHTKQWDKLFYPRRTSRKNVITPDPYTRLLRNWSYNVRKTQKKKVNMFQQKRNCALRSYRKHF